MVKELVTSKVLQQIPGRAHVALQFVGLFGQLDDRHRHGSQHHSWASQASVSDVGSKDGPFPR